MKGAEAMDAHDPLLSQAYRDAARDMPSAALDARILAAARQATQAKPAPRRAGGWRWLLPASSMAVLVLAIGVVMRVRHEAPENLGIEAESRRVPAAASPAMPDAPVAESGAAPGISLPPPRAAGAPESVKKSARAAGQADMAAKRAAEVPREARHAEPVLMDTGVAAASATRDAPPPARAPMPAAVPPPAGMPRSFPERSGVAESAASLQAASPAPRQESADMEMARNGAARAIAPAALGAPRGEAKARVLAPEAAIEAIRVELRVGHVEAARRLLREFEVAYPGHALPEDLLELRRAASGMPGQ
jgi:hypothetical protein